MKNTKRIIVACGSGIATSGLVAARIEEKLRDRGMFNGVRVDAINIANAETEMSSADIFVNVTPNFETSKYKVKVFNGIPFLTGVGVDAVVDEIIAALKN